MVVVNYYITSTNYNLLIMSERKDSTLGRYEKLLNVKGYAENSIKK